jgi:hypothetical protein
MMVKSLIAFASALLIAAAPAYVTANEGTPPTTAASQKPDPDQKIRLKFPDRSSKRARFAGQSRNGGTSCRTATARPAQLSKAARYAQGNAAATDPK